MTLLDQVLEKLRDEFVRSGKEKHFDRLKTCLIPDGERIAGHQLADELQMTESALKVAAHRFRQRYRQLLREAIVETLADPSEAENEINYLLTAMRA